MKQRIYIDTSVIGGCFDKEFHSVALMRSIRNKKQREYETNPELRIQRLSAIREEYKKLIKTQKPKKE